MTNPFFPHNVVRGPKGHAWFCLGPRIYRDGDLVFEAADHVNSITFDDESNLWIASAGGLY